MQFLPPASFVSVFTNVCTSALPPAAFLLFHADYRFGLVSDPLFRKKSVGITSF